MPTSAVIAMAVMPTLFVSTPTGIPLDCGHDGIDLRPAAECSVSADGVQGRGKVEELLGRPHIFRGFCLTCVGGARQREKGLQLMTQKHWARASWRGA